MRGILARALSLGISAPALAEDMPKFEPEAYCKKVASFGGNYSAMVESGCITTEREAYDDTKVEWQNLAASIKTHCDKVAKSGGGSYAILKRCIEIEQGD
jgi:hypothetical protein